MSTEPRTVAELVSADRRQPDVGQFSGGVASDERHAALRASVRKLGTLLGEALQRHEGAQLLDLVEQVRGLARRPDDGVQLHELLSSVDDATAIVLARAFTAYFQLANITEQLHRWQELSARPEGPLASTVGRIAEALEDGTLDRGGRAALRARGGGRAGHRRRASSGATSCPTRSRRSPCRRPTSAPPR